MLRTDIIDPATLTGYARESMSEMEAKKGSLARWLPNRMTPDIVARFYQGETGLVDEATYRAYDAEMGIIGGPERKRVTLELPAVGAQRPVSEYAQLRNRNASDATIRDEILRTARQVVRAVADRTERMRGTVLVTGKATIQESGFISEDDFGRDPALTATAGTLWSDPSSDVLTDLTSWAELYEEKNNVLPGALLVSPRIMRTISRHKQFAVQLQGGAQRPASSDDVRAVLDGQNLPPLHVYSRSTKSGKVIPDDRVLLLPAPALSDTEDDYPLGGTWWGQTLASTEPEWGIAESEQPGIVLGVFRGQQPPMIAQVVADAIALPVAANANLSACFKVL